MRELAGTPDDLISTACRLVQSRLEIKPKPLHRLGVCIWWYVDLLKADHRAATEWQIDGGAIPVLHPDESTGGHRERLDRPPGFSRQHDDAETRNPGALRDVCGQRHVIVLFERARHLLEGADAALAEEGRAVIAGAPAGADAEPLGGDCVELAVAVPRDQNLGMIAGLRLDERGQEELAMPERDDRRHLRLDDVINIRRLVVDAVGPPHQTQILSRLEPDSTLKPAAAQCIPN